MKRTNFTGSKSLPKLSNGENTAITAVALQDHLMRNLNLSQARPLRNGPQRPKQKPIKAVVDTGRGDGLKATATKSKVPKEYVLDPKPPPLTLAQKLGLIQSSKVLTEDEWKDAKNKSNQREDSKQPCVICKEEFGTQEQVLLSCTHVFHKACIQAFERFTGKKSCPMCRREQYQTRVIYEGATYHHHRSATRIQALWRGYVVKRWYQKLRETVPPKDPLLRKKFYEQKLQIITDRMMQSVDTDIDGFFQDLDQSLAASRDIFKQFESMQRTISEEQWETIQLQAVERGCVDCPICLTALDGSSQSKDPETTATCPENSVKITEAAEKKSLKQTTSAKFNVPKRQMKSAKTFLTEPKMSTGDVSRKQAVRGKPSTRTSVLLSCSHVFHQVCLETFEDFTVDRNNMCPVCRSPYQKRLL